MNRDDIIRMAQEAGFETAQDWALFPNGFVRGIGADPYAATRRAIVKAAAEIGKNL